MSPEFPFPTDSKPPRDAAGPTFLVYGAPRCATTTLQRALDGHPEIFMSPHKEPGYFAFAEEDGHPEPHVPGYYATRWSQYLHAFNEATDEKAVGEASPFYLALPRAHEAVARHAPGTRLIVCLRDPAERASSHFGFHRRKGIGKDGFWDAWDNDGDIQPGGWSQGWALREFGRYGAQLDALFEHIPRAQVLCVLFEDLVQRRQATFDRIFSFLGVAPFQVPPMAAQNPGGEARPRWRDYHEGSHWTKRLAKALLPRAATDAMWRWSKRRVYRRAGMPRGMRRRLTAFYRDDIMRTQEILDRDLSRWMR